MFELKKLHKDAIPTATAKAERYRFLADASASESICRDILAIDPDNQQVTVMLILTLTDQFAKPGSLHMNKVLEFIPRLNNQYQREYYSGVICERWAKAQLLRGLHGSSQVAFEWLRQAMTWYEKAEAIHPPGNDEAILRWNSCVRVIASHKLEPHEEEQHVTFLE